MGYHCSRDVFGTLGYVRSATQLSDASTADTERPSLDGPLIRTPRELSSIFKPTDIRWWRQERFEAVKKVEEAPRNLGQVLLMRDNEDDKLVAVKVMPNSWVCNSHPDFVKTYPREIEFPWQDIGCNRLLNALDYEYAPALLGVYRDTETTYVVTSFVAGGDLFAWSSKLDMQVGMVREKFCQPRVVQILQAVQQLHDLGVSHRDISAENIVMAPDESSDILVNLIDFGMASTTRYSDDAHAGKVVYQAPESHTGEDYDTYLSDAFAVGVTLYSLLCRDYPWRSTKPGGCKCFEFFRKHGFRKYINKRKLRLNDKPVSACMSEALVQLLEGLLEIDPSKRLTLGESVWRSSGRRSVWDEQFVSGEEYSNPKN